MSDRRGSDLLKPTGKGEFNDLRGAVFRDHIDVSGRRLGNLDLSGAVFAGSVVARGAIFTGLAWLRGVKFQSSADFSGAVFCSDARFDFADFSETATFSGVEYRGIASFDEAAFRGIAYLDRMVCLANLSLDGAIFGAAVTLQDTECIGGFWGNKTVFPQSAEVSGLDVHGRAWTAGSTFAGEASPPARFTAAMRR